MKDKPEEEVTIDTIREPATYDSAHDMLKAWAVTPNLTVAQHITVNGKLAIEHKLLTVDQRIRAAAAAADFYAPKLKSVDNKNTSAISNMDVDDIESLITKLKE